MTYKVFDVEFEDLETLFDLKKPIETFKTFVLAVGQSNLAGSNFNRYWDPERREVHPKISIRLNLIDDESGMRQILRVAQDLLRRGEIRHFRPTRDPWDAPNFVIKAHETATACAIKLKEELDNHPDLYENLRGNHIEFMGHFVRLMLQHAGFNFNIAWTYLRTAPPSGMDEIARSCASILAQSIGRQNPEPSYIERFLHCFFNCTVSIESTFINWLITSQLWNQLANSWRLP